MGQWVESWTGPLTRESDHQCNSQIYYFFIIWQVGLGQGQTNESSPHSWFITILQWGITALVLSYICSITLIFVLELSYFWNSTSANVVMGVIIIYLIKNIYNAYPRSLPELPYFCFRTLICRLYQNMTPSYFEPPDRGVIFKFRHQI